MNNEKMRQKRQGMPVYRKLIAVICIFCVLCETAKVVAAEKASKEQSADIQVDTLPMHREDTGGKMLSGKGYFDVEVRSEDGQTLSSIRVNITVTPNAEYMNVPYPNASHMKQQKITWKTQNLSADNPYELKTEQDPLVMQGKNWTYTQHGNTSNPEKAFDPNINDGKTPLHYMESAYTIFLIRFSYIKPAYTYPSAAAEGKDPNVRFNDNKYTIAENKRPSAQDTYIGLSDSAKSTGWKNEGTSTLEKGVFHKDKKEYFTMQINMGQTGVFMYGGQAAVCHAKYIITLKQPSLIIDYRKNGATSGKITKSKKMSYNDTDNLHNFSTFSLKKAGYMKNSGAEWNTKADGTGTGFDENENYTAIEFMDFKDGQVFTEKKMTVYAQWIKKTTPAPKQFEVRLYANVPKDYKPNSWHVGATWALNGKTAAPSGGVLYDATALGMLFGDGLYIYKTYQTGKSYSMPQSNKINIAGCTPIRGSGTKYGWWTGSSDGVYINIDGGTDGKVKADALADYVDDDGILRLYAHWEGTAHTMTINNNGGSYSLLAPGNTETALWSKTFYSFTSVPFAFFTSGCYQAHSIQSFPIRNGYLFDGWTLTDIGGNALGSEKIEKNEDEYGRDVYVLNAQSIICDVVITAQWRKVCNVTLDPNGGSVVTNQFTAVCGKSDYAVLTEDKIPINGDRTFLGWYTEPGYGNGTLIYHPDGTNAADGVCWRDNLWQREEDITLFAHWSGFRVELLAGEGIEAVYGGGIYQPGETVVISAKVHEWYDFEYWAGTPVGWGNPCTFVMPDCDLTYTATATNGKYKIEFNSSGGEGYIAPIYPALIGRDVTLPDVLASKEFTHHNEYGESLFLGWNTDAASQGIQYKSGETVPYLSEEHEGTVTLYAIWDTCPGIKAGEQFYTLAQAQSGFLTQQELLSHAEAFDREDGAILAGIDESGHTVFEVTDYAAEEFTDLTESGSVEKTFRVTDSRGNNYQTKVTVHIVDTRPQEVSQKELIGVTRFLSEKYYHAAAQNGGLLDNSVWKMNPAYRSALELGFSNLKNNTPSSTYYFSYADIQKMKDYIRTYGLTDSREPQFFIHFYQKFIQSAAVK